MIILNLKAKNCMQHLLLKPTFDRFSLIEGEAVTYNTFRVDGYIHQKFYGETSEKVYSSWGELRDFFFQIIRGKHTPLSFRFILSLPKENFHSFLSEHAFSDIRPENIQGLYLNFKYDGTSLQCVTGTSLNIFTMDKSLDTIWDDYVKQFFLKQNIDFE